MRARQILGKRSDIFAALAKRRNSESHSGEPEGKIGHKEPPSRHLAQRSFRGGHARRARRTILHGLQNAEKQPLAGRCEQIDAIEIDEPCEHCRIGLGDQPLAGIVALKADFDKGGAAVQKPGQVCFPDPFSPSMVASCRCGATTSACRRSLRQPAFTPIKLGPERRSISRVLRTGTGACDWR